MRTLGKRACSHTHKLNRMPVPDTLHLSVSYLITPWGTIGMRDSLNKRERERERESEEEKHETNLNLTAREHKMERLGVGVGRAEIKNRSDSVWINSVLRYSFGHCWGSRSKHTLSVSLFLSLYLALFVSTSLRLSLSASCLSR